MFLMSASNAGIMEEHTSPADRLLQNGGDNSTKSGKLLNPNDSAVLRNTVILYGIIFLIVWSLFCWLRLKYPRVYNVRGWVKKLKCKLAKEQFDCFSWIWEVHGIPEKQIMDECGMDALCLTRILQWAFKAAAVGAFNALWLIPLYGTSPASADTGYITDYIVSITVSKVPPGDTGRLIGTMLAAYIFFGATIYLLYKEFEWFLSMRFRFLAKPKPRNYAVYVHGIHCLAGGDKQVNDYDLAEFFQSCFGLGRVQEGHVRLHTPILQKLDVERKTIIAKLEHAINIEKVKGIVPTHKTKDKQMVQSIEFYKTELKNINRQITDRIEILELGGYDSDEEAHVSRPLPDEGRAMDGAFVSFYNLSSTAAALQMNHSRLPFGVQVVEAPDPHDIIWANVGKDHKQLQIGQHLSLFLTVALCLLWTIPIAFFSGISNIKGLEQQFDFIKTADEKNPWLRQVLAQVAPFLVVIVNALLPIFLKILSTMEGHVSNAMVNASLFVKLSAFMIIQTFFIALISGSLISQLNTLAHDPGKIVELLATEIPSKSTFFIQLVLVSTVLGLGIELLRIVPVIMAGLRACFGPNLTEKERNTPWLFFTPLAVPPIFNHASVLSTVVFFVMIMFVYAVIAPITSIILVWVFLILGSGYRHQLIYIYPTTPDSGGRMWMNFFGVIMNCMIVAQLVIIGLLGLKKGTVATPLMAPLIAFTLLFKSYMQQRHFQTAERLPSLECFRRDGASDFYITESFEDLYVQPELTAKEALPENASSKLKKEITLFPSKKKHKKKKKSKMTSKTSSKESSDKASSKRKTEPLQEVVEELDVEEEEEYEDEEVA